MRKLLALSLSTGLIFHSLPSQAAQQLRQVQEPIQTTPVVGPIIPALPQIDVQIPTGKIGALTLASLAVEPGPQAAAQTQAARQALYYLSRPGMAPVLKSNAPLAGIAQYLSEHKSDPALAAALSGIEGELENRASSPNKMAQELEDLLPSLFDGMTSQAERVQYLDNYQQAARGVLVLADQTMSAHWEKSKRKQLIGKTIERLEAAAAEESFSIDATARYGAPRPVRIVVPESMRPVLDEMTGIVKTLAKLSTDPFMFRGAMVELSREIAQSVAQAASVDGLLFDLRQKLEQVNDAERLAQWVTHAGGAQSTDYESVVDGLGLPEFTPEIQLQQVESDAMPSTQRLRGWVDQLVDAAAPEDVTYMAGRKFLGAAAVNADRLDAGIARTLERALSAHLAGLSLYKSVKPSVPTRVEHLFEAYAAVARARPDLISRNVRELISNGLAVKIQSRITQNEIKAEYKTTSWTLARVGEILELVEKSRPDLITLEDVVSWNAAIEERKKNLADFHDLRGFTLFFGAGVLFAGLLAFVMLMMGITFIVLNSGIPSSEDARFLARLDGWAELWAALSAGFSGIGYGTLRLHESSARRIQQTLTAAFDKRIAAEDVAEETLRQVMRFDAKKRRWFPQEGQGALFKRLSRQEPYKSLIESRK